MFRSQAVWFVMFTMLVTAPAFAGGADDDMPKQSFKQVVPPVTAGGAETPPRDPKAVLTPPPPEETMITTAPLPPMMRKVTVLIESVPSISGIEVDGVFIGVTPVQVTLKEGVHQMKISKAGYLSWQKTVKAYNGLYVSATLVQESTRKIDITETASAK